MHVHEQQVAEITQSEANDTSCGRFHWLSLYTEFCKGISPTVVWYCRNQQQRPLVYKGVTDLRGCS